MVLQGLQLTIMHLLSCLAFGDLAAKVAQVESTMRLELLHLLDELLEIRLIASCPAAQQMRIGVQTDTQRWPLGRRSQAA